MLARFTDRALKTMRLANATAHFMGSDGIDAEHVLIGLLSQPDSAAVSVLRWMSFDVQACRIALDSLLPEGEERICDAPLNETPRSKAVVARAVEECERLGHDAVGTEHLLLGLLHVSDGAVRRVFSEGRLTAGSVRAAVQLRARSD